MTMRKTLRIKHVMLLVLVIAIVLKPVLWIFSLAYWIVQSAIADNSDWRMIQFTFYTMFPYMLFVLITSWLYMLFIKHMIKLNKRQEIKASRQSGVAKTRGRSDFRPRDSDHPA